MQKKHKKILTTLSLISPLFLSACGGFASGESGGLVNSKYGADQMIKITSSPEIPQSVHCLLENSKGAYNIQNTPEHVDVTSAKGALYVTCKAAQGYTGRVRVTSDVKVIGLLDEVVFGASMWKYPDTINVPMTRDTSHDIEDAVVIPPAPVHVDPESPELASSVSSTGVSKRKVHHVHHIVKKADCK